MLITVLTALFGGVAWIGRQLARRAEASANRRQQEREKGEQAERGRRAELEAEKQALAQARAVLDQQEQDLRTELRAEFQRQNQQIAAQNERIKRLETNEDWLMRYIRQLQDILRQNNIEVPPLPPRPETV